MSRIITPTDTITITIDNRAAPPQANMTLSRDMPAPYVVMILSRLIVGLMEGVMRQLVTGSLPGTQHSTQPSAQPDGKNNGE
jgi:hypothetical protein